MTAVFFLFLFSLLAYYISVNKYYYHFWDIARYWLKIASFESVGAMVWKIEIERITVVKFRIDSVGGRFDIYVYVIPQVSLDLE